MMSFWTAILLAATASSLLGKHDFSGCSQGTQRVVSYDSSLIHPSNVSASSQESVFNPDDYLFSRHNVPFKLWCTEELELPGDSNSSRIVNLIELLRLHGTRFHINVTFTRPLLLTHVLTSGFSNSFVESFDIQLSLDADGTFVPYHPSGGEQAFETTRTDTVFPLTPPIAARKIRLTILGGILNPSRQLCWHLTLLGCPLDEAIQLAGDLPSSQSQLASTSQHSTCSIAPIAPVPAPPSWLCSTSTVYPVVTVTEPAGATPTPHHTPGIATHPLHSVTPTPCCTSEVCPVTLTKTVKVATTIVRCEPSRLQRTAVTMDNITTTEDVVDGEAKSCRHYRLILYVVPSMAVGLLLIACLGFACVSVLINFRSKSRSKSSNKEDSGVMLDNVTYESREEAKDHPQGREDGLGMIDNELYKSRSSVLPPSVLRMKHIPTHHHGNSFNDMYRSNGNTVSGTGTSDGLYENCRRLFPGNRSTFGESMTNRSTLTTDIEQSIKSVDSMVDNPTYSVPLPPIDYHAVSIFPQRSQTKPYRTPSIAAAASKNQNHLIKGVSAIDLVDNECYSVPSSMSGQDDLEQSLVVGQLHPVEYETPK